MATLFSKSRLKTLAQDVPTADILPFLEILRSWKEDYYHGSLKHDKETSREQAYNNDIFGRILGYTQKPNTPFTFQPKASPTVKGQLPDAVISYNGENISAVVELKGASIELDRPQQREGNMSPIQQAFKYKIQYRRCPFVIVSNFYEFRLYQDNQLDYEQWTLDDLLNPADDYLSFKTWYVLHKRENFVASSGPSKTEQLLSSVRLDQEQISKKFYSEYKEARLGLLRELYRRNERVRKNIDFGIEKAQKIVDRLVFVCFAEDRGLLPENILYQVEQAAKQSVFGGSLWNALKGFFEAIDKGSVKLDIPQGYNGGLFKTDPELNTLEISDEALTPILELGKYDFEEEVSVSILGHIFEQSISDLEEIKRKVNTDLVVDSKRKKDGIFYTPDYIVRYIVDNSLGAYLRYHEDKFKQEFGLKEDIKSGNYAKREREAYNKYLTLLQNIKVVDPACGSGAFLVHVFDYLLAEHKRVGSILNDMFSTDELIRSILSNNIYGVDLNAESVEITKLSLWLKTAQKGKKLTSLDANIKCGNSLIDDSNVAGSKAFNWQKEFPEVFKNGGFDVVVGNPPYFNIQTYGANSPEAQFIQHRFAEIWQDKSDILFYFLHLALSISKGAVGFITSNAYLFSDKAQKLRNFLVKDGRLTAIVNFEKHRVFEDASITSCISIFTPSTKKTRACVLPHSRYAIGEIEHIITNPANFFTIDLQENDVFALVDKQIASLNKKIDGSHKPLREVVKVGKGMETAANEVFVFSQRPAFSAQFVKRRMLGENISRYHLANKEEWLLYVEDVEKFEDLPEDIHKHLLASKPLLEERATVKNEGRPWWRYSRPMHKELYHHAKIWCSYRAKNNEFVLDTTGEYIGLTNTTVIFDTNPGVNFKYLLGLLNSKLLNFRYKSIGKQTGSGVYEYFENGIGKLPIALVDASQQQKVATLVTDITQKIDIHYQAQSAFEVLTKDLLKKVPNQWWKLNFADFLVSSKTKLSLSQKDDLLQIFTKYQTNLLQLDSEIADLDNQIDNLVYQFYNLTPQEIQFIESAGN